MKIPSSPGKNTIVRSAKIVHLCSSGLMLVCGLLFLFIRQMNHSAANILVGAASILIGIAGIYGYFSNDSYRLAFQSDFAFGIFLSVFGVLLIINPDNVPELLPCAVGILAIMDCGNKTQISFEGARFGMKMWFLVLILAVLELAAGLLVLISACRKTVFEPRFMMGLALAAVGVTNFWTTMYMVRVGHTKKQSEEEKS